ncbi:hypothetical protein [Kocuria rosea]|uniref:Uncharacterized protein n=1 Tax=Kocuria rosea TaxID=1275 RepID=A0A4R5YMR6_KOCRO|nr:hypothetical protein [Kocuria rosea]TDL46626.1 hypothetical protein E2R59_00975 [Kocuria rosea]
MSTSTGPRELLRDPPQHPRGRRTVAAAAALLLGATGISASTAATEVVQRNPGGLTAVGPVNTEHGFPAWYEDSGKLRTELCLDGDNPLCAFPPGDVPDPLKPISFPDNFPGEAFYMLAGSEVEIPGGGDAVLTLALEAAFANENPIPGDQVVFSRQRIDVDDAAPNTTLTFTHPYGTVTVDTDERGRGRLVEDVSPAVGNFQTPLKGDIGPFLRWDSGAPEGYLGNPDVAHTVTGSPLGTNFFEVTTSDGGTARNDQFSVMGKISTNTGVQADRAVVGGGHLDVFATSRGDQLEVVGQDGVFSTTPMEKDEGDSERAYARIAYTGAAPATVTVRNLGDKPVSSAEVAVTDVSVATAATYDGTALTVEATSASGTAPEVAGFGALAATGTANVYKGSFPTLAPPVEATVSTSGTSRTTVPVVVTGGEASPVGEDPVDPAPDPGPVTDGTTPDNPDVEQPAATAAVAALPGSVARGMATELDGSGSANAASYEWSQLSGPEVAFSDRTVARPKVVVPFFTTISATAPAAADQDPVLQLVVKNAAGVASSPATITLKSDDVVTVAAASRHRIGKELRLTGTALVPGAPSLLNPATSVNIYNTTSGTPVKVGSAPVDSLGNWEYRAKPGPGQRISSVLVQSTRGGEARGVVGTG